MDLNNVNEQLTKYIKPLSYPLAVKMLTPSDKIPEKAKRPKEFIGDRDMLCKFTTISRRYGWIIAADAEENFCPMVRQCFGFSPLSPAFLEGEHQFPIQMIRKEERAKMRNHLPKFEHGKYSGILIAPLFRASSVFNDDFEPDVIFFYGMPAQVLVICEGLPPGEVQPQIGGGACIGEVIKPMVTGNVHVVAPCPGDRIVGQAQDWEMIFSMPLNKVELVLSRLEDTYNAGHRYPIPQTAQFGIVPFLPPSYKALSEEIDRYEQEVKKQAK